MHYKTGDGRYHRVKASETHQLVLEAMKLWSEQDKVQELPGFILATDQDGDQQCILFDGFTDEEFKDTGKTVMKRMVNTISAFHSVELAVVLKADFEDRTNQTQTPGLSIMYMRPGIKEVYCFVADGSGEMLQANDTSNYLPEVDSAFSSGIPLQCVRDCMQPWCPPGRFHHITTKPV